MGEFKFEIAVSQASSIVGTFCDFVLSRVGHTTKLHRMAKDEKAQSKESTTGGKDDKEKLDDSSGNVKEGAEEKKKKADMKKDSGDLDSAKKTENEEKGEDEKKDSEDMDVDADEKKEEAKDNKKRKQGDKEEDEKEATTDTSKRRRRSSQTSPYQPEDFKRATNAVQIFRGRGDKLGDIESVKESIDKYARTSEEMTAAHKFLFSRGRVPRNQIKGNILEFSGFLKYFDEEKHDKAKVEKEDEDAEVRFVSCVGKFRRNTFCFILTKSTSFVHVTM